MSQRRRIRASDIASPNPRKGLLAMVLIGIALLLILFFKSSFGDSTAGFMEHLTHDPDLELPPSATDRAPGSGAPRTKAPQSAAPGTVESSAAPSNIAPSSAALRTRVPSDAPMTVAPTNVASSSRSTVSAPARDAAAASVPSGVATP